MMLSRRGLILGIGVTLAAPAIVRAESIMKVRALPVDFLSLQPLSYEEKLRLVQEFIRLAEERHPHGTRQMIEVFDEALLRVGVYV